jgi:hypothetical protein
MPKCKLCQNEAEGEAKLQWMTLDSSVQPGVVHFHQSLKQETNAELCGRCYEQLKAQLVG